MDAMSADLDGAFAELRQFVLPLAGHSHGAMMAMDLIINLSLHAQLLDNKPEPRVQLELCRLCSAIVVLMVERTHSHCAEVPSPHCVNSEDFLWQSWAHAGSLTLFFCLCGGRIVSVTWGPRLGGGVSLELNAGFAAR